MGFGKAYYCINFATPKKSELETQLKCQNCEIAREEHFFYSVFFLACISNANYRYYLSSLAFSAITGFGIALIVALEMLITFTGSPINWIWLIASFLWGQF
jgi:hypothetical protein